MLLYCGACGGGGAGGGGAGAGAGAGAGGSRCYLNSKLYQFLKHRHTSPLFEMSKRRKQSLYLSFVLFFIVNPLTPIVR